MPKPKVVGIDHGRYGEGIWNLPQEVIDSHAIILFSAIPYHELSDLHRRLFYQKCKNNFDVLKDFSDSRKDVQLFHMEDIDVPERFFKPDFKTEDFNEIAHNLLNDDYYMKIARYHGPTLDKMKEVYDFIQKNKDKDIIVSCSAGFARTGAIVDYLTSTGWELDTITPGAHTSFHANDTMLKLLQIVDENYTPSLKHERKKLLY